MLNEVEQGSYAQDLEMKKRVGGWMDSFKARTIIARPDAVPSFKVLLTFRCPAVR